MPGTRGLPPSALLPTSASAASTRCSISACRRSCGRGPGVGVAPSRTDRDKRADACCCLRLAGLRGVDRVGATAARKALSGPRLFVFSRWLDHLQTLDCELHDTALIHVQKTGKSGRFWLPVQVCAFVSDPLLALSILLADQQGSWA